MASKATTIGEWVRRHLRDEAPRSKSLIITVFGDSIAPLSAGIWLGDLIALMAPFGVNERLVRTSAFRLVDEGWLKARRDGRRSHYTLTAPGALRFEHAFDRVYRPPPASWDESWTVVLLPRNGDAPAERLGLRRELEWEGFASPAPGLLLHPAANRGALRRILEDRDAAGRSIVFQARGIADLGAVPADEIVAQCWSLADAGARYRQFVQRFEPLLQKLSASSLDPALAFQVQTLLIHAFRRATLHDPRLPTSLLPARWPGVTAYEVCRSIYQRTWKLAREHLERVMGPDTGPAAPPAIAMPVHERYGGL